MADAVAHDYLISSNSIRHAFNVSAERYDEFSFLQQTITDRLLESFDQLKIKPGTILDLGSGTGYGSQQLKQRFKNAHRYQCDLSDEMLKRSRKKATGFFSKDHFLCANANQIPLADDACDLVFSSLMLQWCGDLDSVFAEIKRVLKPGGIFLFTSFGPDTLKELRQSWGKVDKYVHANAFVDMHDIGDALIRNGLSDPVLNIEHIVLTYADCTQLMRELKGIGAQNINSGRRKTLTGKRRFQQMLSHYETFRQNGKLPATYEVIYGHAWRAEANKNLDNVQAVSLQDLKKEIKKNKAG